MFYANERYMCFIFMRKVVFDVLVPERIESLNNIIYNKWITSIFKA